MPTERWRDLERLFGDAVAMPADRRAAFLASAPAADAALRDEVAALLSAEERSGPFLSSTAIDAFAAEIARDGWTVQPGDRIGCYTVERRLGAGGMGEVWRAHDDRLGRDVAIKLLLPHPARDTGRVSALQDEARAASALNHTNVLTVYDVGDHHGAAYLVTECLEGQSLRARLSRGPLAVDAALEVAAQVARGLAAAHARGIVHCDLKPENIFLGADHRVKILDFGLATLHEPAPLGPLGAADGATAAPRPVFGTAGYLAPEQIRGDRADHRTDIFALGVVVHEMIAGRRPGAAPDAALQASPDVARFVHRCLEPAAADRFPTTADMGAALDALIAARRTPETRRLTSLLRRPLVVVSALLLIAAAALGAWRWQARAARVRWAHAVAAPMARELAERGSTGEAYLLARQALDTAPHDPVLQQLWLDLTLPQVVTTEPADAEVAIAPYRDRLPTWIVLGRTPLPVRLPRGQIQMRLSKAGYQTLDVASAPPQNRYRLDPVGTAPPGMVRVSGGPLPERFGIAASIDDFWIARLEVTNREYKVFLDQGGYRDPAFWREPFVDAGRTLSWQDAMQRFRDKTGQPGPATWTSGTYPPGRADYPVEGVSWYEATAYAAFAGARLPTIHHWYQAAALGRFADILTVSNFSGVGAVAAGSSGGLGPFGTQDMAGNVKEWCSTDVGGRRTLLGGSWDGPRYAFAHYNAGHPFERGPGTGLRLARYDTPPSPVVAGPVRLESVVRDGRAVRPVDDAVYAVMRRQYAYDHLPLNAVVEATETTERWRKVTVAFDAAYDGERLRAFLFLPANASPPYQTVVLFPAGDAFQLRSSRDMSLVWVSLVVNSGRALLYPVYKGTYERGMPDGIGEHARRERRVAWSRDLGRAIDWLETRPDIDRARLAYWGVSVGGDAGVALSALEPRLRVSVLQGTGIWGDDTPDSDSYDHAPRLRIPVLMLNGRYDFATPLDTAQRPLFDLLGSAPGDKRHAVFETGHALPLSDVSRELLPFLDRYLGPVRRLPSGAAIDPPRP
jgi:serine/threonine protein kinase/dienelactone hydrolase